MAAENLSDGGGTTNTGGAGGNPGNSAPNNTGNTTPASAASGALSTAQKGTPGTPTEGQYGKDDWRSVLPQELVSDPSFKAFAKVEDLAKSFLHAQKTIGSDKVALPSKHATEEDYQAFYDKIGRPKVEDYKVNVPKDAKFIDQEWMKELVPTAHKAGVLPAQLEKIVGWYEGKVEATHQAMELMQKQEQEAAIGGIKKEWGKAYEPKVQKAVHLLEEHGSEDLSKWMEESGNVNNPHLIRLFASLADKLYGEDNIVEGGGGTPRVTPETALQKAGEIVGNKEHPYHNADHPNHKAAVAEVSDLYAMAYPKVEDANA